MSEDKPADGVPRALADFGDLSPAERELVDACLSGEYAMVCDDLPSERTEWNHVRADFLRFLVVGGDPAVPMHAHGVQLFGAWVSGLFDLEAAVAGCEMYFGHCIFEKVHLQRAKLRFFAMCSSILHGDLDGDDVECDGSFLLIKSVLHGKVSLDRARIEGAVDCSGGSFLREGDNTLSFDSARVSSAVLLRDGFLAKGTVRLIQASIGGALEVRGATFEAPDGIALRADRVVVGGSVFLVHGFIAHGRVRFTNARIGGNLDCTGGRFEHPLGDSLGFDGATIGGSFIFGPGSESRGTVRLLGADIGMDLNCCGGVIARPDHAALMADGVKVARSVFMRDGFNAAGEVRLLRATIGETLDCTGATIDHPGRTALLCDGAHIHGDVFFRYGFASSGEVRLVGVTIGGSLSCADSTFEEPGADALSCENATIAGAFFFRAIRKVDGGVDLTAMRIGTLCDDTASWDAVTGPLSLDGFTYARFGGRAPTDARMRVAWLAKQGREDLDEAFRPQPWEQLIWVLRGMGHQQEARRVAIAKQSRQRQAGKIPRIARPFHWLYGALIGYGYKPGRLIAIMCFVWLCCAIAYWLAANPALLGGRTPLIAPVNREPSAACLIVQAMRPASSVNCQPPPPDYANFVPLVYSLDVLMPVVNLGYKTTWQPVVSDPQLRPLFWGQLLRFLYWFEIAFGWTAGVLLVGVLGNLIKKD